jgi:hypothetical protein
MQAIEMPNKFGVDLAGRSIRLLSPPHGPFSARDAYLLAAYLVNAAERVADPEQDGTFSGWLTAIEVVPDKNAA